MPTISLRPVVLLLALLTPLSLVRAQSGGPVTVEADRLELNQKTGVSIYQGNVKLQQKGMQLQSQRLELHNDGKQLKQAIADGEPVRLEQTDPQTGELTRAHASHMEYHFDDGLLELKGEAYLWRGNGDEFSGNHLIYDANAHTVRAFGDKQGNSRVKVILQPEKETAQ